MVTYSIVCVCLKRVVRVVYWGPSWTKLLSVVSVFQLDDDPQTSSAAEWYPRDEREMSEEPPCCKVLTRLLFHCSGLLFSYQSALLWSDNLFPLRCCCTALCIFDSLDPRSVAPAPGFVQWQMMSCRCRYFSGCFFGGLPLRPHQDCRTACALFHLCRDLMPQGFLQHIFFQHIDCFLSWPLIWLTNPELSAELMFPSHWWPVRNMRRITCSHIVSRWLGSYLF